MALKEHVIIVIVVQNTDQLDLIQRDYNNDNIGNDKVGPFAGPLETCAPLPSSTMQVGNFAKKKWHL